jgi:hypothetical protein
MRTYRCTPELAQVVREAAKRLCVNESALTRYAVINGVQQIVSKHLNQTDV